MRNLFFALVLLNLAFAAWTAWYADPPPRAGTPRETGVAIRLVGEAGASPAADGRADEVGGSPAADGAARLAGGRPDSISKLPDGASIDAAASFEPVASVEPPAPTAVPRATAGVPPRSNASADAVARCVSIGPFAAAADAEAASAALAAAGYTPAQRAAEGEIWVGFWVHINAIPTRDQANAMLARLREGGLPDAYLIPGEEDGDIISLGVFNDMARAGRLEAQVREIGLVPLTVERSRPGLVHWLDVAVPAGGALDLDALGIREDRVEQTPCEGAG